MLSVVKEQVSPSSRSIDMEAIARQIAKERAAITMASRRRKIVSVFTKNSLGILLRDTLTRKLMGKEKRSRTESEYLRRIGVRLR